MRESCCRGAILHNGIIPGIVFLIESYRANSLNTHNAHSLRQQHVSSKLLKKRPFYFVILIYLPSVESGAVLPISEIERVYCSPALCGVPGII